MRILLIEDQLRLAELIEKGLQDAGIGVDRFRRGDLGLAALETTGYDGVVLDLGLPDIDGLDLLRAIRRKGKSLPVLILTSRVQVADRVRGLDAGADDYMVKPFAMEELAARLRALMRRPTDTLSQVIQVGNVTFETNARQIGVGGKPVFLSSREVDLLEILMRRVDRVVSKPFLESNLYGSGEELSSNSVEVLLHRLRKKLENADAQLVIHTVRGVGYMLSAGDA